jgi:dCTP deaminase
MFWSHEKLASEWEKNSELVNPFDKNFIKYGAYELGLGEEVFLTSGANDTKKKIGPGDQISIPPGQFGLLMTEERLKVPADAIGFISIKFSIKQQGLVNVSGFHVDPGFEGRLKFAVYNAGANSVPLTRGERVFMIWFCDLYSTKHAYQGEHANQDGITSGDVRLLQGELASPAALHLRLKSVEDTIKMWRNLAIGVAVTIVGSLITALIIGLAAWIFNRPSDQGRPPQREDPSATVQPADRSLPSGEPNTNRSSAPTITPSSTPKPTGE